MDSSKITIWHSPITPEMLNGLFYHNLVKTLDIRFTEVGPDYLKATMPVDYRTRQPYGLLNGGASVALAESLGSTAGGCVVDATKYGVVGMGVNANHIKSVRKGLVTGITKPMHLGSQTQVWEIKIYSEIDELVCASRLTLAVVDINRFVSG